MLFVKTVGFVEPDALGIIEVECLDGFQGERTGS
jgi:hypothetical protein